MEYVCCHRQRETCPWSRQWCFLNQKCKGDNWNMWDDLRTDPLNAGWGKELNRGRGSVVDSKFLCSEYDSKVDREANETNSWEWDHSCNTRNVIVDGKYLEEVDSFDIDGIQGRHIAEYYEQRQPKGGCCQNIFCGVVSRNTVVVRSRGFLASPRR